MNNQIKNRQINTQQPGCMGIAIQWLITLITVAIIDLLFSLPLMWLWNWLMPMLFGLKTITWIQALGVMLLSSMLFNRATVSTK